MSDKIYTHKMYQLRISFLAPMEGVIYVEGKNEEDAIETAKKQLGHREGVIVASCNAVEDIEPMNNEPSEEPPQAPLPKEKMN